MAMASCVQIRDGLQPGDLILVSGESSLCQFVKVITDSRWSHVGMVVRRGGCLGLWESAPGRSAIQRSPWPAGARLVPLAARLQELRGAFCWRRLSKPLQPWQEESLLRTVAAFEGRPFRHVEQLATLLSDLVAEQQCGAYSCSELVALTYQRLGLLDEPTARGRVAASYLPRHFGGEAALALNLGFALGPETWLAPGLTAAAAP